MAAGGMIGFELKGNDIRFWLESDHGSRLSKTVSREVSTFQAALRESNAVDRGTVAWFANDAQMGAVRVRDVEALFSALKIR